MFSVMRDLKLPHPVEELVDALLKCRRAVAQWDASITCVASGWVSSIA